jgi:hypothetical protein
MNQHPNVVRFREAVELLSHGELDSFLRFWSDDAVMHVPGSNSLSGNYSGRNGIRAFVQRMIDLSGGTFRLEPLEELADDKYLMVLMQVSARRGGMVYDVNDISALKFDPEGNFKEYWWLPADEAKWNEFGAEAPT